jgi:hypothetical protein
MTLNSEWSQEAINISLLAKQNIKVAFCIDKLLDNVNIFAKSHIIIGIEKLNNWVPCEKLFYFWFWRTLSIIARFAE